MKKGIIVILLLVVIVAAAPFGFSFWADARLNTMLTDINKAGLANFTVIKSQKGWLSTDLVIEAELAGNLADGYIKAAQAKGETVDIPKVILSSQLYHGPFPVTSNGVSFKPVVGTTYSRLMKGYTDDAEELLNIDYQLMTSFELSGKNKTLVNIADWKGPVGKDNAVAEWRDLNMGITLTSGLSKADIDMSIPYLKVEGQGGHILIDGMNINSSAYPGIEDLSLGEAKFTLKQMSFTDKKTGDDIAFQGMTITGSTTESGNDNVDSTMNMRIDKLNFGKEQLGPAVMSMAFRNLDAGALARINKQVRELQSQKNMPQQQQGMMIMATMASEMGTLLKKGPVLEITDLSLDSAYGKLNGSAELTVDTSNPQVLSNPFLVKDALVGDVQLSVPEALLVALQKVNLRKELQGVNISYTEEQIETMAQSRVEKMMSRMTATNIFVKRGETYYFEASLKNGVPEINGQPIQIPAGGQPGAPSGGQ